MPSCQQPFGIEIRPGVFRPDWSAVTTAAAREALLARFASRGRFIDKWSTPLDERADSLWQYVLRLFVDLGRGPRIDELSTGVGWPPRRVRDVLQELERRDLLSIDGAASLVLYAYPFAERPTGHTVLMGARVFNVLCAIDALGVGAMFQKDVVVMSRCRACGMEICISITDRGQSLYSVSPADAVIWYDLSFADTAATSCCPKIAFFCCTAHLQIWRDGAGSGDNGRPLLPVEALEIGRAVFGPVLAETTGV
jgi:hypothetical protein